MHEAVCTILGGHSVDDDEIKFGYAVTGTCPSGARQGQRRRAPRRRPGFHQAHRHRRDFHRLKRGIAADEHVAASIEQMLTLNRTACEEMLRFDVHGCTDVTGFGLIGHAREMAMASGVTLEIKCGVRALSSWRGGLRTRRRHPGRPQEQSGVRILRCGREARIACRNRGAALRPADFRRPADLASRSRRRHFGEIACPMLTASAALFSRAKSPSN